MRKECKQPYYAQITSGRKTVEGRVKKGDWAKVEVGQKIEFFCSELNESTICEVAEVINCGTFAELFEQCGQHLLPGIKNIDEAVAVYRRFYGEVEEREYGVVGIVIKRL